MRRKRYGVRQPEADNCFGSQRDVTVVTGKTGTRCTGTGTRECADCSTLAAASQASNQGASSGTAADEAGSALAFARSLLAIDAGADGIACSMYGNRLQRNPETCSTLEFTSRLGIGNGATD